MNDDPLATAPAIAARVTGWDLSPISSTVLDPGPSWDYEAQARALLARSACAADIGTGGGEVLARIATSGSGRVYATETWQPNSVVAHRRLAPTGIGLVHASSLVLPFAPGAFDAVIARHEELSPAEVDRVLRAGGTVLTQQVSSNHWPELRRFFPQQASFPDHDRHYRAAFEAMGYDVRFEWVRFRTAYRTVADLAAMLLVCPWEVRGFDLERHRDAVLAAAEALGTPAGIVLSEGRYLLRATKPG